ncbi:putative bifunctional diguanylate cyclase/phosphodiesterase [Vreelandella titanicae]|uniref:putative bifunctional diguanylate cyclase/phosphodiesterase n=1 Tax=Vreelandella titanicae TaxID=664683 RepID=UPI001680D65A|nr:bifunctional diguanylate cyclase/phosphodiesterase [Halomonas titanicae]QNU64899.1 EAL domain-containing protein [Halomonas titanicae]
MALKKYMLIANCHIGDICQNNHPIDLEHAEARLRDAEAALQDTREWAQSTLNSIGDAVITTDLECHVTYLNRVAENLTGWMSIDAFGKPLSQVLTLVDGHTFLAAPNPAQRAMEENRTVGLAMDCVLIRKDGSQLNIEDSAAPIHDRAGCTKGAVIVFHDACQSPAQSLKLAHQAQHDSLTGLPNRVLLAERLSRAIGLAKRHQHQVALIYLDLDAFKPINDSLGHAVGDALLKLVAGRLSECVRDTDTICRQGGDEFVVLLSEIEEPEDAARIAQKILSALAVPYRIDNHELHITTSIGISLYPDHGIDARTLLNNADTAMYHAKGSGSNHFQLFRADMNELREQRSQIELQLHRALKEKALFLEFQPRIDIANGYLCSTEALVRWRNPALGLVQPSAFLPVAEACGLIRPIGHWILFEACHQLQRWREQGLEIVPIAVNMSAMELRDRSLPARITEMLSETRLDAHFLEIEVTESSLMYHQDEAVIATLVELNNLGIRIAIDDFGAGSESLKRLKCFPINTINIAPCFVHDMLESLENLNFIKALINFGQSLALRVIAKGVEAQTQLDQLILQGCDGAQGFLFSKPLSANDYQALLVAGDLRLKHSSAAPSNTLSSKLTPPE